MNDMSVPEDIRNPPAMQKANITPRLFEYDNEHRRVNVVYAADPSTAVRRLLLGLVVPFFAVVCFWPVSPLMYFNNSSRLL